MKTIALSVSLLIAVAALPPSLSASDGPAIAQAEPETQPTPPFEPSEADLACEADLDCTVTCQFSAWSCCPTYCTACTHVLNQQAHQRQQEQCRESGEECPTVGACAEEPTERSVPRCIEGSCTYELIPVDTSPPSP